MADAEFTFKATGAETVVAANKRIEQSMQQQAKASSKSGYAVLEASRALEDFSMAGMRGALNNIPQLLMNLGVGAGLTGVIGALTIVVWKGTEYLDKYITSLREAKLAGSDIGISQFNAESIKEAFGEEAVKKAKQMLLVLDEMARAQERLNNLTQIYTSETLAGNELNHAQEMLNLTRNRATEEQKGRAELEYKIKLAEEEASMVQNKADVEKASLEDIKRKKEEQQKIIQKADRLELDAINKKVRLKYVEYSQKLMAAPRKRLEEEGYLKPGLFRKDKLDDYDKVQLTVAAGKLANKYRDDLLKERGLTGKDIEDQLKKALIAEEEIKILDEKIKRQEELIKIAEDNAESAKKVLEYDVERLKLLEERANLERQQKQEDEDKKKAEEENKKQMAELMKERGLDVSSFLSNQARVGLGGNEAKTAMDTLSVSKQQLAQLKEIARNTKHGKRTAYN